MVNPFKNQSKSTAQGKFGAMGLPKNKAKHTDEADSEQVQRIIGRSSGGRLDKFARGGRTKATSVNIVVQPPQQQQQPPMPMPMRPPMPAMPPPTPPAGGAAGAAGAAPPLPGGLLNPVGAAAAGAGAAAPMMPQMPPMGRASGGRIGDKAKYISGLSSTNNLKQWANKVRKNSYHAKGGRIGMTAGAESGEGRLQKIEKYGKNK